ncbi:MAG: glycosyltransferase family 4 protein [Candidatus Methylomirabilales bacterium]
MRIGCYTFSFLPTVGGAELLLHGLAESLAARGHEVTVWAPRVRRADNRLEARYRLRRYARPSSKRFGVRQTLPRLLLHAWRRGLDVLHCHGAYPEGYVGAALKRAAGVPLVIRPHGADVLPGEWIARHPRLRSRMQAALLAADAVVAQGAFLAEEVRGLGVESGRLRVIHNGVHLAPPPPLPDAPGLLAVGSLSHKKGLDVLLRALAAVAREAPAVRLVLAGEGPEAERLRALAGELGIAGHVRFAGVVTGPPKTDLLAAARIVVVPSRREPFSNALLEAMAAGRAVVATAVGGSLEVVEDGRSGLLVPPEDPAALAAALLALLRAPERARALAEGARKRAEEFSWERMVDAYEALYREVAGPCVS